MGKNKWFLNGGRGSGKSIRLLCETYENKIADLQYKLDTLQGYLDHDIEYDMDKTIQELRKENAELKELLKDKSCLDCKNLHTDLQLTKAKEILHKVCYEFGIYDKDLMEEAKQFLKNDDCSNIQ